MVLDVNVDALELFEDDFSFVAFFWFLLGFFFLVPELSVTVGTEIYK